MIATPALTQERGVDNNVAYGIDTTLNPLEELQINGYWTATDDGA